MAPVLFRDQNGRRRGEATAGNTDWIPGRFRGRDVFIVGGGPSLGRFDFESLQDRTTICINDAVRYVPEPDVMVFLDPPVKERVDIEDLKCRVVAGPHAGMTAGGRTTVINTVNTGPSASPEHLYGPSSSALVALNLALLTRPSRIFLLGLDKCYLTPKRARRMARYLERRPAAYLPEAADYYRERAESMERSGVVGMHFYDSDIVHPRGPEDEHFYTRQAPKFTCFRTSYNIYNLSPISRITGFRFRHPEETLL